MDPHADNKRARFSLPLAVIVGLIALQTVLDAVDGGLYRELLKTLQPQLVLGIFSVLTLSVCWLWTPYVTKRTPGADIVRQHWRRAALIPTLWFAGSIPEAYAVAILPIYISVSIGAFTFALDTLSDVFHHRIRFSLRTFAFILLVLCGIGFAIYSS